jgi:multicomponent Na+:H+ antiporter subunit D
MSAARRSAWFDWRVIDGVVDGLALSIRALGGRLRHGQAGQLQINVFSAVAVIVVLLLAYALACTVLR